MKKTLLALATTAISTVAFAQSATNIITTSASPSTWDKIKENASISYTNELYGREFGDFNNSDKEGLYHSLSFGYKVGSGKISVNPRFETFTSTRDSDGKERGNAVMINPRVGYATVLYGNDNYSIFNSTRLEFGINDQKTDKNRIVKLKQYNAISFNLNSKNTLDVGVELYRWFYDGKEEPNAADLGIYAEVIHMYSFTDKIALHTAFEFDSELNNSLGTNYYSRIDDYAIVKIGPEFFLNKNTSLFTAAQIGIDQPGNTALNSPTLFVSLSTSI